ncbi:MAG: hypothetical protein ACRYG8_02160 [Janthinobacterium lividum]
MSGGISSKAVWVLANVERELRAAGTEVTIHALWVALADRGAVEGCCPRIMSRMHLLQPERSF